MLASLVDKYVWHIKSQLFFLARTAPFRVEFFSDGIEVLATTTTIADTGSKGAKLKYWQNSC